MAIGTCYTLVHDGDGGLLAQEDVRCCASPKMTIGAISLSEFAVERLRAALCQPDPAAEARATLEQARVDGVIQWYTIHSPNPHRATWQVIVLGEGAPSNEFGGATEAEALAAAAAHVEGLREVVVRKWMDFEGATPGSNCDYVAFDPDDGLTIKTDGKSGVAVVRLPLLRTAQLKEFLNTL